MRKVFSFGFDQKYLRGRYFDESLVGWFWVFRALFVQKLLGYNKKVRWPISPSNAIDEPESIDFNPNNYYKPRSIKPKHTHGSKRCGD